MNGLAYSPKYSMNSWAHSCSISYVVISTQIGGAGSRIGVGTCTCAGAVGVLTTSCFPTFRNADDGISDSIIITIIIIENLYAPLVGFKHIFCVGNTCSDIHLLAFDTSTHPLLFLYSPTRHQAPFLLEIGF